MFARAGASPRHGILVANLVGTLWQQLRGKPCRVYPTDVRLRVSSSGLYTYPDVMVVCGEPQFADDHKDTLLNPIVIIEVLSDSTRDYDRGQKFQLYRTLPSLSDYMTVAQDAPHIEHWTRQQQSRGLFSEYEGLAQTIQIPSIGCVLAMAEVYDKVDWAG